MDKVESKAVLKREMEKYRQRAYEELQYLLKKQDIFAVATKVGNWYQLEFQAVWDDKKNGDLRVIGSIHNGGIRVYMQLTDSFIISPDGVFVGE